MRSLALISLVLLTAWSPSCFAGGKQEGKGKIELEVIVWKQEATDAFEAWGNAFHELNPNVDVVYSGVGNYTEAIKGRAAANTLPAVLSTPGGNYGFGLAKDGWLMDLTDQKFLERVKDGILPGQRYNGKIYSLPIDLAAQGFIYNKKVFRDVGVEVPTTWDELFRVMEKIKARGITPLIIAGKDYWTLGIFSMTTAMPFVYGPDPDFDMNVITGKKHFTGTEWSKAMDIYAKLLTFANKDLNELSYGLGNQKIATGDAAMVVQGIWAVAAIKSYNNDADLGFFLPPADTGAAKNVMILGPDMTVGVNVKHNNKDMALKFVEFLTTDQAVRIWTDKAKIISAMRGAPADFDPFVKDVLKYVDQGVSLYPLPNHMWFQQNVWLDWSQKLQEFNAGKIPAIETQKALESFLFEAYKLYTK